jgi:DNA replication protein DnaC
MSETPQLLLAHHLKALRLPTFLREYDKLARQCAVDGVDHVRYLVRLSELELIDREHRMVERRIRQAKFPAVKSLDSFDFRAIPSLNKMLVLELARCEYVERRENIIALGNSGTGKTHVALGLGLAACQKGLTVGFITAAALVHELMEEAPAALADAVGKIQAADHRRTRLRAAQQNRRRTSVRGVQPTLRAWLHPTDQQSALRRVDGSVRLRAPDRSA